MNFELGTSCKLAPAGVETNKTITLSKDDFK